MRAQLSNRDYEQLSAYIDGQLTPAERHKVEERLRAHSELQAALDELARTRALLRSAPRRRAPRNFTLTPAMVGERAPGRRGPWLNLFPALSFTAALATLALVATVAFQFFSGQAPAQTVAMAPQAAHVEQIVKATMTAMQLSAPAGNVTSTQSVEKPEAPQTQRSLAGGESPAQPTPSQITIPTEAAQSQPMTALTATPAESVPALPAAGAALAQQTATPEPAAPKAAAPTALAEATSSAPPVIVWNSNAAPPQGAYGLGGGGGGQGPSMGTLLGPPAAPATPPVAYGKGGGGGAPDTSAGGTILLPPESVSTPEAANDQAATTTEQASQPTQTETPQATSVPETETAQPVQAAQPNPAISGTGPILGVPGPDKGGKIVERKAILGQPEQGAQNRGAVQPAPGAVGNQTQTQPAGPLSQTFLGFPVLAIIQALLIVIAVVTGVTAYVVRRRVR